MKGWSAQIKAALFLFCGLLLAYITYSLQFRLSDFTLRHESGREEAIRLPLLRGGIGPQTYIYSGYLEKRLLSSSIFRITPDNEILSIKINDEILDLTNYSQEALGDFRQGVLMDFSRHLRLGGNKLEIVVADYGGDMGLSIRMGSAYRAWIAVGCWTFFLLLLANNAWRQRSVPYLHRLFYVLIAAGVGIRIWTVFTYNPVAHIWSDAQRHWEAGIDVLRVDLMTMTDPIMYQLYISALAKLTLKIPVLVAFYTSFLSIVTPWIWYRFFRELQSSKTLALLGWAALALLPSWISIYSYFMQETLFLPLLGAALWATWRARRKRSATAFGLMVVIWIAAGLTRGVAIPFAAICCTWLWVLQPEKVKKALISTALLALILGPLTYRSYHAVNQFAPHGMGHLAAIYGMSGKKEILLNTAKDGASWGHIFGSPSTGAEPFAPFSDWKTQRSGRVVVSVDFNKGKEDWDRAYESVALDFDRFLWITKENLIFLFFATSWPDSNMARILDQANAVMRWIWAPVTVGVMIWLVCWRRRLRGQWMLPVIIGSWILVQGLLPISVNEGRYRKPFEGLLLAQVVLLMAAGRRGSMPVMRDSLGQDVASQAPPKLE
ncbi:MAG: hypothetical protein NVV73_15565 [Cellvibrionaceae bacterium]|nr:hypothetical protein [Cellvibrionaceae bacterium]